MNVIVPKSYMQIDSAWKNLPYAVKGEVATIGSAGCGPTTCAMIISTLTEHNVTPVDACSWSIANGFKAYKQGTYYSFILQYLGKFGIKALLLSQSNIYHKPNADAHKKAIEAIKEGDWVVCCMGKGRWTSSGHFVLWYANNGNQALIRDPNSTKANRIKADISVFQNEIKYCWRIKVQDFLGDKEVVEERVIQLFGKDVLTQGILKDGKNYISPRVFENAGLVVTNEGSKPVIKPATVKVQSKGATTEVSGFKANGTNYVSLRELTDILGVTIDWDSNSKSVIIR